MIENETTGHSTESTLRYDVADGERVSEAVIAAVADAANADPARMDPLADFVDPDALDAIFADRYDGTPRIGGTTRFPFSGYEVEVTDGRYVTLSAVTR
ncbi:HalOD1 output domain-containing protein [Halorussus amylolyticus]|uniref:HalOD1 output domain-containing protein n=1 Tax=Halorussus amylolyticus TaxID=1126242 RepID=UPI00138F3F6E|nr:HalOD1 output domain-containing protein [Halorussus amylolyticus]